MKRRPYVDAALLLAATVAFASCRQIAGIQDLPNPCGDPLVIDDMEDGDGAICNSSGRHGSWFVRGDGSSSDLAPQPFKPTAITDGSRAGSRQAAHFEGSGFSGWGALMGLDLNVQGTRKGTYDVSAIRGVRFWMRTTARVSVQFPTLDTATEENGGSCGSSSNCNHHFAFQIEPVASGWKEYTIPFKALRQLGSAKWKPSELLSVTFAVEAGVDFNVWVDDVVFDRCDGSACLPTCTEASVPVACAQGCFPPGTDCAAIAGWCADPLLIDDMEDGDMGICESLGRHGFWFTVGDGSSGTLDFEVAMPPDGERGTSHRAAHFTGSGFNIWGALLGLALNVQDLSDHPYDANTVGGIKFWMKSNAPIQVMFRTPETISPANGGECVDTDTKTNCNNHFSFFIPEGEPGWTEYEVPFAALDQRGGSATFNPRFLVGMQFNAPPNSRFDVWIDDLSFFYCPPAGCALKCANPALPKSCPAFDVPGVRHYPAACRAAGTECTAPASWCTDPLLIDDMEDADPFVCDSGERTGNWYSVTNGGTIADLEPPEGAFTPTAIPGGRGASRYAARLKGSASIAGARMGFYLAPTGKTYDAGAVSGLKFWMKSKGPVAVDFQITEPTPLDKSGGACDASFVQPYCYSILRFTVVPEGEDWAEYAVPFAALQRWSGGADAKGNLVVSSPWDPTRLIRIEFTTYESTFDYWVDDIRFYSCGAGPCLPTCPASSPVACAAAAGRPADCWPAGTDCAARPDIVHNTAAWGSGPNDVWAVGYSGVTFAGTVLHYDGAAWSRSNVGTVPPLWDVTGSGADDLWIAGDHGTILRRTGSAWSSATAGTDASMSAVWANGPGDAWALGYPGTVRHWNGSVWSTSTSVDKWMYGMWASAANDVWAVGDGGTILHFDGAGWSQRNSHTTVFLNRVWGTGPGNVWAVADGGPILHYDGMDWAGSPRDMGGALGGVWGSGPDDVWAVGYGGAIARWNGAAWSAFPNPVKFALFDVWGSAADDVWAVGVRNTILHFDGVNWKPAAIDWGAP